MKIKLLILTLLVAVVEQATPAYVTVEQTTDPTFMQNGGYSALTTDIVNVSKARANNEEFYTAQEIRYKKRSPISRFFWRLYQYTDPASEDYSFFHHDTKFVPV